MLKHQQLTEQIIKAFFKVYNTLGYGFLEKVYQNALQIELENGGLRVVPQAPSRSSTRAGWPASTSPTSW
jgi:GxxExxY protein